MKVKIEKSGGLTSLVKSWEVEKDSLSKDEAAKLQSLISESGLTKSVEKYTDAARDLHQFEIVIESDNSKIHAIFDDKSLPDSVKPLIGFLKTYSTTK